VSSFRDAAVPIGLDSWKVCAPSIEPMAFMVWPEGLPLVPMVHVSVIKYLYVRIRVRTIRGSRVIRS